MKTDNEDVKTLIDVKSQVTLSIKVSAHKKRLKNWFIDDIKNDETMKIDDNAEKDEKDAEKNDSLKFIKNQKKKTNDSIFTKNEW